MQFTTYYRKAIWERFKNEADKSGLVNRLLERHYGGFSIEPVTYPVGTTRVPGGQVVVPPPNEPWKPSPHDPVTGYPCCLKKTPCKHWPWNSDARAYVNTLTGEIREVAF